MSEASRAKPHLPQFDIFGYVASAARVYRMSKAPLITQDELRSAAKSGGYPEPPSGLHQLLVDATQDDFDREELAMLLAQMMYESEGFQKLENRDAAVDPGDGTYNVAGVGLPEKSYHGRGLIKLAWADNYKAASEALGLGDQLLKQPELVADNLEYGLLTSVWYWREVVRAECAGSPNTFGLTTRAMLNGPVECSGGFNQQAYDRYQLYLKVAGAMGIQNKASECGCYDL
ncbi:hypothetical protein QAD02_020033 [Eretmocerus hayati]|uniref:Uncharacterized protein n=1 Tax=Eretmocerus hayati TaxID=131215 RepID=A0ACC2PMI1_9HYME|nr:hypothetical protein QAD02_020033 [Eretmocerus hayati]